MSRPATGIDFAKAALLSVLGSTATAFVFFAALYAWLPESDGARQIGLVAALFDPFVLTVALPVIGFGALVAYFLWLLLLRHRSVERCAAVVFAVVCASILGTTPSLGPNVLVVLLALVGGALLARALPWTARDYSVGEPALARAR